MARYRLVDGKLKLIGGPTKTTTATLKTPNLTPTKPSFSDFQKTDAAKKAQVEATKKVEETQALKKQREELVKQQEKQPITFKPKQYTGTVDNISKQIMEIDTKLEKDKEVVDIGKTAISGAVQLGKGIIEFGESAIVDPLLQAGSSKYNPYYVFNPEKYKGNVRVADELIRRQAAQETIDKTLGYGKKVGGQTIQEMLDEGSSVFKSTSKGGQLLKSAGAMLPIAITGQYVLGQATAMGMSAKAAQVAALYASSTAAGGSAYGSAVQEALRSGATREEATKYGLYKFAAESASEWIFGGVPGTKIKLLNKWDKLAEDGIEKLANPVAKFILSKGYRMAGEGVEEGLVEFVTPYLQNATYTEGQKVDWDNVLNATIDGAILSGILDLPTNMVDTMNKNIETKAESIEGLEDIQLPEEITKPYETITEDEVKLYRGGKDISDSFSTSENIAQDYAKNRGGEVKEYTLSKGTKIIDYNNIPNIKYSGIDDYNVNNFSKDKSVLDFMETDLEADYTKASKWAKENDYDAIKFPTEAEIRILNNEVLTEIKPKIKDVEIAKDKILKDFVEKEIEAKQTIKSIGKLETKVKQEFGTTDTFDKAGFITTDAELVDFSKPGISDKDGTFNYEHIDVEKVADINDFMQEGAIRIGAKPDTGIIEAQIKPNQEQINKIIEFSNEMANQNKQFTIDLIDGERTFSKIYDNFEINSTKIKNDINSFYETKKQIPIKETKKIAPINKEVASKVSKNKELKAKIEETPQIANVITKETEVKPTFKGKVGEKADATIQKTVNSLHYVDKMAKSTNNLNITYRANHTKQARATAENSIGVNQVDLKGNVVGESLTKIFTTIPDADIQNFYDYLAHKHNIDRFREGKPVFGDNVTSEDSMAKVKSLETDQFKEVSEKLNKYNQNLLQVLVDSQVINQETMDMLVEKYPNYVPTFRVKKGTGGITVMPSAVSVKMPIKKAVGGTSDIRPFDVQIAENTIKTYNSARLNMLGLEILNTARNSSDISSDYAVEITPEADTRADMEDYQETDVLEETKLGNTFTVYENGEKVQMIVSDGMFESLSDLKMTPDKLQDTVLGIIPKLTKGFKGALTQYNPFFTVTNFSRDLQDAILYSKSPIKFLKQFPKAYKEIATNGKYYQKYMALGGGQASFFDGKALKIKAESGAVKGLNKLLFINEMVELAPRLTAFMNEVGTELNNDVKLTKGMYEAADITVNFGRSGKITKTVDKYGVPFLNAGVQGFDKMVRTAKDIDSPQQALGLVVKLGVLGILPSLLNEFLYKDDEDYKQISNRYKDTNYLIKMPNGNFMRIPKGRVLSMGGMIAQRSYRWVEGEDKAFADVVGTAISQVAPSNPLANNFYSPFINLKTNKNWFGGEIVPMRLKDLPKAEQFDEKTTSYAKAIGDFFNISPKQVDYLIDSYTGVVGDIIQPTFTNQAERNIFEAKFTVDPEYSTQITTNYYDLQEKLTANKKSKNATDEDILKSKYMNSRQSTLNDMYSQKREIQNSNKSDKEKGKEVRELQIQINDFMEETMNNYDKIKYGETYAEIDGLYFQKDDEGEYSKISAKTVETKKPIYEAAGIGFDTYLNFKYNTKDIESDVKDGKTVSGSKKKKIITEISKLKLSVEEKMMMIYLNGYSIQDGDLKGYSESQARKKVANYVNDLKISVYEKSMILNQMGYDVSNGKIRW